MQENSRGNNATLVTAAAAAAAAAYNHIRRFNADEYTHSRAHISLYELDHLSFISVREYNTVCASIFK